MTADEPPLPGMTKVPYGLPLMGGAWLACVKWAISEPDMLEAFTEATGHDLERLTGRSPLEAMVDKATGFQDAVMAAFCDWVTENVWGEEGKEAMEP